MILDFSDTPNSNTASECRVLPSNAKRIQPKVILPQIPSRDFSDDNVVVSSRALLVQPDASPPTSTPLSSLMIPSPLSCTDHSTRTTLQSMTEDLKTPKRNNHDVPALKPPWHLSSLFEKLVPLPTAPSPRTLMKDPVSPSCLAVPGTRELVEHYDTVKSPSLQQHMNFKHQKWGEDEFCDFDFDITDAVNLDVSTLLSDSLAQCVQSYSATLRRLATRRNRPQVNDLLSLSPRSEKSYFKPSSLLPPESPSVPVTSSRSSLQQPRRRRGDSRYPVSCGFVPSVGDLAIPRNVQNASVSFRPLDLCPKRRSSDAITLNSHTTSSKSPCPRRFRRRARDKDGHKKGRQLASTVPSDRLSSARQFNHDSPDSPPYDPSSSDVSDSCGDTFRVCPRRSLSSKIVVVNRPK